MGGKTSGTSTKRGTLPKRYRRGVSSCERIDYRRPVPRAFREAFQQYATDQGGVDEMPAALFFTAEHAAFVRAQLRQLEAAALAGKPFDIAQWVPLANVLIKLHDRLGYTRKAKRLPSLHEYMAATEAASQHDERAPTTPASGNGGIPHGHPEARAEDPAATADSSATSPDVTAAAGEASN